MPLTDWAPVERGSQRKVQQSLCHKYCSSPPGLLHAGAHDTLQAEVSDVSVCRGEWGAERSPGGIIFGRTDTESVGGWGWGWVHKETGGALPKHTDATTVTATLLSY